MTDAPKRINETAQLLRLMAGVFQMDPRNKALILRAADELDAYAAVANDLLESLKAMVDEQVDYMTINNLGDPEKQHNIKLTHAAISKAEGTDQ